MPTTKPRVAITMAEEEYEKLWMMKTRPEWVRKSISEILRHLVRLGLEEEERRERGDEQCRKPTEYT